MQKIKKIINKKNISQIRKHFSLFPHAEIADFMQNLNTKERVILLKSLKTKDQAELFSFLEPEIQKDIIKSFSKMQIKKLLNSLYTEEAADFIEDLPSSMATRILEIASPERRKEINKILNYSDDVVGSIMSTDIITLNKSWTISQALKVIRDNIKDIHFSKYFYVVDSKNKLVGYVKIKDIIFEKKVKLLKTFIKAATSVQITTVKEEAALIFAKHDLASLPVVDYSNHVMGIINSDSVIDVIQEEANEDFQVMAGIKASEKPYSKTKSYSLFKSRFLWLMLLMISSTISQIVLDAFLNLSSSKFNEQVGSIAVAGITSAMVAILPVISGAAGNAGSQSSTTIIRALATGDITTKDYLKVFGKELKTSSSIGFVLALVNFARLSIYYLVKGDISDNRYIYLSLAASLSLMLVIILAQVVGGILPLIAKWFKMDPAVMAAPVLTTLIDTISIVIFFGISIGIMLLVV